MSEVVKSKPKLLVAMRPQGAVAVERVLGEYAELVKATTYDEAVAQLRAAVDIDLVLCGIYFDETRMFDLLRFVRQGHPAVPVVCARIGRTEVPKVSLEAMAIAAMSMGAAAFIDVKIIGGDTSADHEFRSQVLRHVRRRRT